MTSDASSMPALAGLPRLAAALAHVQANLPKLERDRRVEVEKKTGGTYEYSYVTLANLNDEVLPLLAKHGLAFVALPGAGSDGKMCVRYMLLHESGELLSGEFPISGEGGIQMIGGRITYARRYCLAAVVGVAADEDDESRLADDGRPATAQRAARGQRATPPTSGRGATAQRARAATGQPPLPGEDGPAAVTQPQLQKIVIAFDELGVADRADRLRLTSALIGRELESAKQLTKDQAHDVIDVLAEAAKHEKPFTWLSAIADERNAERAERSAAAEDGQATP